MPDPFLTSARDLLRRARDDMRAAIDGLPPDALNWRPAGDDTTLRQAMVQLKHAVWPLRRRRRLAALIRPAPSNVPL